MPHSTNTKKQLAITTSPAIASLWKLIAILIEFSHWQILTSFRNTSNERRTHLDHRSCALCSLVLQGVLFSLQGRLKTKSQPMKALQNTVIEIIALMWSLPSGKLWQFASESLNWAWRCHFTSLPLMAAVLRYMFLLGVERSMSVGLLRLRQRGITEAMGHLCDSGSCVYECVGCMAAVHRVSQEGGGKCRDWRLPGWTLRHVPRTFWTALKMMLHVVVMLWHWCHRDNKSRNCWYLGNSFCNK